MSLCRLHVAPWGSLLYNQCFLWKSVDFFGKVGLVMHSPITARCSDSVDKVESGKHENLLVSFYDSMQEAHSFVCVLPSL